MVQYPKHLFLLLFGLLVWQSALAQSNKWGLPPSPNGKLASALLDAINESDAKVHQRFVEAYFAPAFKDEFPMEAHLGQFQQMHQDLAGAQLNGVNMMMGATAILDLMMTTEAEEYMSLKIEIEQGASPLVAGLRVEASEPPPTDIMVRALLAAINESDAEAHQRFVEAYFAPAFKDELPMDTHLNLLQQMHQELAGATMVEANAMSQGGSDETVTLTLETNAGERFTLTFDIQLSSPPRLITLSYTQE